MKVPENGHGFMSPRLITQLAQDNPRILLVGSSSPLKKQIEAFLVRNGLDVENIEQLGQKDGGQVQPAQDFYRIVLLGTSEENYHNYQNLPDKNRLLLINLVTSLDEQSFVFPEGDQIIGLDVVTESAVIKKLGRLLEKVTQGMISDPKTNFYLQSETAFLQRLKPLLLSPQKHRLVIKGKEHSSQTILAEIQRLLSLLYKIDHLVIKDSLVRFSQLDFAGFDQQLQETETLPALLEPVIQALRRSLTAAAPVTTRSTYDQRELLTPSPHQLSNNDRRLPTPPPSPAPVAVSRLTPAPQTPSPVTQEVTPSPTLSPTPSFTPSIDDQLTQLFKEKRVDKKIDRVKDYVKITKKAKKITKKSRILFALSSLVTVLAATTLILFGLFWWSTRSVEKQLTQIFTVLAQSPTLAVDFSALNRKVGILEQQTQLYSQFLPPEMLTTGESLVEISRKIVEFDQSAQEYQQSLANLVRVILGKDLLEDSLDAQKQAQLSQSLYETALKLLSRLNDFRSAQTELDKQAEIDQYIELINQKKNSLIAYQQLSPTLGQLLGQTAKRNYALVFQNNQELRPTGGFLQAVAIVTLDKGMIVDTQVFSSYELDQRLGGAVAPPDEVIKLLGENKWYLRDSNWDPDFSKSGRQIAWFLEQELDKKIDGVIGINLFVFQNLLRELGPLELEEFNEVITDKNIFERSEFHSEVKLVDTSNVEDYQAKLLKYLIRDLMTKGQDRPDLLLAAIKKSLSEKHMVVYITDPTAAAAFSDLGWSGELVQPECPTQLSTVPCQVDSLIVNEANIGINKANYHTTRSDTHEIEIANSQIKHRRTITLDNQAYSNAWPKGEYRSYFRFYLPEHAQSLSLEVDGQKVNEKEVVISTQNNHLVVGLVVTTPIKTQKTIELNYSLPMEFSQPYSYAFFSQKQPGTVGVLDKITLKHDATLFPTLIAPQAEVVGNTIIFSPLADDHAFVGVSFK